MTDQSYMADAPPHAQMAALIADLGIRQTDLAADTGHTPQTINTWVKGRKDPPQIMLRYLQSQIEIRDLKARMAATDRLAADVQAWLDMTSGR